MFGGDEDWPVSRMPKDSSLHDWLSILSAK
jgi:hypothetical protein